MNLKAICRRGWLVLAAAAIFAGPALAGHTFDGNILFNNPGGNCDPVCTLDENTQEELCDFTACQLVAHFPNNDLDIDPLLGDPFNLAVPNWVPAENSIASGNNDNVVNIIPPADPCNNCECSEFPISLACFRGAIPPPSRGEDWTHGWTCYEFQNGGTCNVNPNKPLEILQGQYFQDLTLTADKNYLLRGRVAIGDSLDPDTGYVLTIEPGTALFGEFATDGYLVIERGSKIYAVGTREAPIVMTSEFAPEGLAGRGDWGGLVMHGKAIANCADCLGGVSCISEGNAGPFCGTEDCDDSGELRFVRVEYAGIELSLDNELNAFTWNALGCNTKISYCQSIGGDDDMFEWFGGKVSARYLVGIAGADDGLDWQMGWRGSVQYAVIQYHNDAGDNAMECDNNEREFDAPCRSNPTISNVTLIGVDPAVGGTADHGAHLRHGTDATIVNSIMMGFTDDAVRVQHPETASRGFNPIPGKGCTGPSDVPDVAGAAGVGVKAFPNPATSATTLSFELPQAARTRISIYDTQGRLVERVMDEELSAGAHNVPWNLPQGSASGTYFYRVRMGDEVSTGRIFGIQ
jgi:hypothetical protein